MSNKEIMKNHIASDLHEILGRFDYYTFLNDDEKKAYDLIRETIKKVEEL